MRWQRWLWLFLGFAGSLGAVAPAQAKTRIFIVSSYHREYLWDQDLAEGTNQALIEFGWLDNAKQGQELIAKDAIESGGAIIKKAWMDTKRKKTPEEITASAEAIKKEIDSFKPDVLLVSDDNGTNKIGNLYKDKGIPVVFCGVDSTPIKYGLVDSKERPGHNVTGVYQMGFYQEALAALTKLVPGVKTFGMVGDASGAATDKMRDAKAMADRGELAAKLVDSVSTDNYDEWKTKVADLAKRVDAIMLVNHNTLKDKDGKSVDQMEAGAWYLKNIKKPDFSSEKQFVQEGVLLIAEDSGYKQGFEMVRLAHLILRKKKKPAEMPAIRPSHGPIMANAARAKMLGLDVANKPFIERVVDKSLALEKFPN